VCFGDKCNVLQKLLTAKEQLWMHIDMLQQALLGRLPSSPYGGGGAATAVVFVV
jgi:hypothetical protein